MAEELARLFCDLQKRLTKFVESGQLGIFANGYWGHPAYKLPAEVNLIGVAHYLEALEWQKEIVKVHTIFGGKNPHPNYLVGGVPCSLNIDEANAINAERLAMVGAACPDRRGRSSSRSILPDLLAVAAVLPRLGGDRRRAEELLCYGDLPTNGFADLGASSSPAGPSSTATSARCIRWTRASPPASPGVHRPFLVRVLGWRRGMHPWAGETKLELHRPDSRRTSSSTSTASIPG